MVSPFLVLLTGVDIPSGWCHWSYVTINQNLVQGKSRNSLTSEFDSGLLTTIRLCVQSSLVSTVPLSQATPQCKCLRRRIPRLGNRINLGMYFFEPSVLIEHIVWPWETRKALAYLHCKPIFCFVVFHRSLLHREVHLLDLIRAHEGNSDHHADDPSKINWAKYNMVGKFIAGTTQSQEQCRTSGEYDFEERPHIRDLLLKECLMDVQVGVFPLYQRLSLM